MPLPRWEALSTNWLTGPMTLVHINCPICEAAYQVPEASLAAAARIRCGRCGLEFTQDWRPGRQHAPPFNPPPLVPTRDTGGSRDSLPAEIPVPTHQSGEPEGPAGIPGTETAGQTLEKPAQAAEKSSEPSAAARPPWMAPAESLAEANRAPAPGPTPEEIRLANEIGPPPPYLPGGRARPVSVRPPIQAPVQPLPPPPPPVQEPRQEVSPDPASLEPEAVNAGGTKAEPVEADTPLRWPARVRITPTLLVVGLSVAMMIIIALYGRRADVMRHLPLITPVYKVFGLVAVQPASARAGTLNVNAAMDQRASTTPLIRTRPRSEVTPKVPPEPGLELESHSVAK